MKADDKDQQQEQSQNEQSQSGQGNKSGSGFGDYYDDRDRQSDLVTRTVRQDEQSVPLITKKEKGS